MLRHISLIFFFTSTSLLHGQWVNQKLDTTADFRGLMVVDPNIVWVSGTKGTVACTANGGKTWNVQTLPGCDKLDFRDVKVVNGRAYAMSAGPGEASQIWNTADDGKSWTKQFTLIEPKGFLDSIAFWDVSNGLAVGDPVDGHFQLVRTTDGKTWTVEKGPKAMEGEGCFAASGSCLITNGQQNCMIVTGGAQSSRILSSTDRGKSWTSITMKVSAGDPARGIFAIHFRDQKHGMVVGGDYKNPDQTERTAAVTQDGGINWSVIDGKLPYRSSIACEGTAWIAVGPTGTSSSIDDGLNWKTINPQSLNSVRFVGKSGYACGPKGLVVKWVP